MSVRKRIENIAKIDIDALIEKGAKVKEDKEEESKKWTYLSLRIPVDMVNAIDKNVQESVGITRTGWILQAIHEKLKEVQLNEQ